jgi:cytochrome c oxidase assembly protein subunit 11
MSNTEQPSNRSLVIRLALSACAMFAFGFALVPLYDIFCEVTGIRIPIEAADAATITEQPALSRPIRLELLANTNSGAPWEFAPVSDSLEVSTGLMQDTEFVARNLSDMAITGIATPDIRPAEAGRYFRKVECFCFDEQDFAAGEERNLSVKFYVDPDLPAHIDTITLSYTLFAKQKLASNQ